MVGLYISAVELSVCQVDDLLGVRSKLIISITMTLIIVIGTVVDVILAIIVFFVLCML